MIERVDWTDEMISRLTELWNDGVSISQIGKTLSKQFGVSISRNAAGGKARRIGLPERQNPVTKAGVRKCEEPAKPVKYPRGAQVRKKPGRPPVLFAGKTPPVWDGAFPPGAAVYPDSMTCQWLDGDVPPRTPLKVIRLPASGARRLAPRTGEKAFGELYDSWAEVPRCNHPRVPGRPYCQAHCLRAYDLASIARMESRK